MVLLYGYYIHVCALVVRSTVYCTSSTRSTSRASSVVVVEGEKPVHTSSVFSSSFTRLLSPSTGVVKPIFSAFFNLRVSLSVVGPSSIKSLSFSTRNSLVILPNPFVPAQNSKLHVQIENRRGVCTGMRGER